MKKIIPLLLALLILFSLPLSVSAEEGLLIEDGADLLTEGQESSLNFRLEELSRRYKTQIAIVTRNVAEGDVDVLIGEIYDGAGYGYGENKDGVLLLICMDVREFRILANGREAEVLSPARIDAITEKITPYLTSGDYKGAFDLFAGETEYYLNGVKNGFPFDYKTALLFSFGGGIGIALITVLVLSLQLKSVRRQDGAAAYVKAGSLNITRHTDLFLYRNVSRTAKPKNNSSSGGGHSSSRNIGGGKF